MTWVWHFNACLSNTKFTTCLAQTKITWHAQLIYSPKLAVIYEFLRLWRFTSDTLKLTTDSRGKPELCQVYMCNIYANFKTCDCFVTNQQLQTHVHLSLESYELTFSVIHGNVKRLRVRTHPIEVATIVGMIGIVRWIDWSAWITWTSRANAVSSAQL